MPDAHGIAKKTKSPHLCRRLRDRVQIIVVIFAWFLATGSQWDVAQVIAWGRMFAGYSNEMSVGAAFEKTFSGEMCPICRAVQKAKQEQDSKDRKMPEAKNPGKLLDLCPLMAATEVHSPARQTIGIIPALVTIDGEGRMEPPLPPPRAEA